MALKSFTFNSIVSTDYGIMASGNKTYNVPARSFQTVSIPGRNAPVYLDNGRWNPVTIVYQCSAYNGLKGDMQTFLAAIARDPGYHDLVDEWHPGITRKAFLASDVNVEAFADRHGSFPLTFIARPEKWINTTPTTITESTNFTNPTAFDAKPIITVTMASGSTSGNLYVSRYVSGTRKDQWKVTFSDVVTDLIMNCETMDFYDSAGNNLNANVKVQATITSGEIDMQFPFFAGSSLSRVFTVDGGWDSAIASVTVMPRWWTL